MSISRSYQEKMPSGKTHNKEMNVQEEHSLRGTFASVMILGLVMGVSWLAVFILFMLRG